jgi:DNA-binding NtrC family response regulator
MRNAVVLVVDDEPLVRWSVSETLRDSGYEVAQASDAQSALRSVAAPDNHADVVLLDLWLPDSADLNVLAAIRAISPRTRVILMSAHGTEELFQQARASGAFMTLHKPFDMSTLPSLIEDALAAR